MGVKKLLLVAGLIIGGLILTRAVFPKKVGNSTKPETQRQTSQVEKGKERLTAQQAYEVAKKEAKKWSSEAFLVKVSNFQGDSHSDGLSDHWYFEFAANGKDQGLRVRITDGRVLQALEDEILNSEPVVAEWIDSPKVMELAKSYWGDEKEITNYWLGLTEDSWSVKVSREGKQPLWIKLDAKTGELKQTREGY